MYTSLSVTLWPIYKTFSVYLCSTQHLPPGFPLPTLLPLLSRLLHLVELHVMPHSDSGEHTSTTHNSALATVNTRLLTAVLVVMENIHRLVGGLKASFWSWNSSDQFTPCQDLFWMQRKIYHFRRRHYFPFHQFWRKHPTCHAGMHWGMMMSSHTCSILLQAQLKN